MSIPGASKSFPYWPANYQEGVQSVSAGTNISITGTATNPIVNANGPSASNVPVPSSTPGTPPTKSVSAGTQVQFYDIAENYLPQVAGGKNCYRFTFNGTLGPPGITTGTGYISVVARLYHGSTNTFDLIGAQTVYVAPKEGGVNNIVFWSFSSIFIPLVDDVVQVWVYNNTDTLLEDINLVPLPKGCGIELVSSDNAASLIFS